MIASLDGSAVSALTCPLFFVLVKWTGMRDACPEKMSEVYPRTISSA